MEANNTICPVCTLYLRPGITLESHLTSHPKQKVIEALVKLSIGGKQNENVHQMETIQQHSQQPSHHHQWHHQEVQSGMQSTNHSIIYQQFMASPQANLIGQQYVTLPTVFNATTQMMCQPYMYQQQQVILSTGTTTTTSSSSSTPFNRLLPIEPKPDHQMLEISEITTGTTTQETSSEATAKPSTITETCSEELINTKQDDLAAEVNLVKHNAYDDDEFIAGSPCSSAGSDLIRVRKDLNNEGTSEPSTSFNSTSTPSSVRLENYNGSNEFIDTSNDFCCTNPSSSSQTKLVEHFDYDDADDDYEKPSVLMNIGEYIYNNRSDMINEDEQLSMDSANIRADEHMPPRGELSGQESNASDMAWARYNQQHQTVPLDGAAPTTNPSSSSTSSSQHAASNYDYITTATTTNEIRDESEQSDDVDTPDPVHIAYDSDMPTVSGYSDPPIQYRCPTCGKNFSCPKERRVHQAEKHNAKLNLIGAKLDSSTQQLNSVHSRKIKKLTIRPKKVDEIKCENNFDNVFTNKLKIEVTHSTTLLAPSMSGAASTAALLGDNSSKLQCNDDGEANELGSNVEQNADASAGIGSDIINIPTICTYCDAIVPTKGGLRVHYLEAHNFAANTKYKCRQCDEPFNSEPKFNEHLKVHPLECRLCGKSFERRQNMQMHMKRHYGIRPYKCTVCEKSFLTKQKLNEHHLMHTGETPIKCTMCDKSFRRFSNYIQHRNRHHLKIKRKGREYVCFCGEVCQSLKRLAWHKEIHDNKPKCCSYCSEKFIHMSSLTRHMRRAHNERYVPQNKTQDENVECPICKGVFMKSSLDVHIRKHSGQRPYTCLFCNKDFTTKWNLKLHKWTHATRSSKPYKCDQCKGAFVRESDYVSHMNSHKSIKPYTCNYCGAQFIRKYNCLRHVREHEKDKSYACQICGKQFHRSYYLNDHMRVHNGIRPFSCNICGKTSTTKSNHNKHIKIHHARDPITTEN